MKMKTYLQTTLGLMILVATYCELNAQDKLKTMPGYERFQKMATQIRSSVKMGSLNAIWSEDGISFDYVQDNKRFQYTIGTKTSTEKAMTTPATRGGRNFDGPARGRQFSSSTSPDGKWKAYTKDRNMYISNADGTDEKAITTDASETSQLKYGIANWVYGEELGQNTAIWWSPDSKKIGFYKFQEKNVKKYYVLFNQLKLQDSAEIEAYPKVGADNLPVDLMMYDIDSKKIVELDTRDGKSFNDGEMGTYLYGVSWTTDGKEMLFHSTNRRQNIMEFRAANPVSGKCRTVVHEEWLPSFTENTPQIKMLADGKRFIWASERSGFLNYYLYNLNGKLINAITNHPFEVSSIIKIDEKEEKLYYMARSGDNHMKMQLHSVSFDSKKNVRITDPGFNHRVSISPDNKHMVDVAETHNTPPVTNLLDIEGNKLAELAKSDMSMFAELGFKKVEVFTFISADGVTQLHGMIHFPSNFDPAKKYPVILDNYGGPSTNAFRENFTFPSSITEYGFIVINIDGRNVDGRGKKLLDQLYGNLGIVEMDDFAAGLKSLYARSYINKDKVGVYGTSYGGTTSASMLLRFPDMFHVAVANSAVTDWRNYDNIYTERYMNLLENNLKGYEASSLMSMAKNLKGELMIYYGTADNNVHPANSLQLIKALQKEGKSFEVQVGPDSGHTAVNTERMMEFFIKHLVMDK